MSVVDNNVLSALAKIERLDVLRLVFENVSTVPGVVEELDTARNEGYQFVDQIAGARNEWIDVVTPTDVERRRATEIHDETLSFVDASCLAVADCRDAALVTDDGHVVEIAQQRGVRVWDLLTLVQGAIRRSVIEDVNELNSIISDLQARDSYRFSAEDERILFAEFE